MEEEKKEYAEYPSTRTERQCLFSYNQRTESQYGTLSFERAGNQYGELISSDVYPLPGPYAYRFKFNSTMMMIFRNAFPSCDLRTIVDAMNYELQHSSGTARNMHHTRCNEMRFSSDGDTLILQGKPLARIAKRFKWENDEFHMERMPYFCYEINVICDELLGFLLNELPKIRRVFKESMQQTTQQQSLYSYASGLFRF